MEPLSIMALINTRVAPAQLSQSRYSHRDWVYLLSYGAMARKLRTYPPPTNITRSVIGCNGQH